MLIVFELFDPAVSMVGAAFESFPKITSKKKKKKKKNIITIFVGSRFSSWLRERGVELSKFDLRLGESKLGGVGVFHAGDSKKKDGDIVIRILDTNSGDWRSILVRF